MVRGWGRLSNILQQELTRDGMGWLQSRASQPCIHAPQRIWVIITMNNVLILSPDQRDRGTEKMKGTNWETGTNNPVRVTDQVSHPVSDLLMALSLINEMNCWDCSYAFSWDSPINTMLDCGNFWDFVTAFATKLSHPQQWIDLAGAYHSSILPLITIQRTMNTNESRPQCILQYRR